MDLSLRDRAVVGHGAPAMGKGEAVVELNLDAVLQRSDVARVLQSIGDNDGTVVSIADAEGNLLWGSAGGKTVFGRELDDYRGSNQFDYVHPEDVDRVKREHERALRGSTVDYRCRAVRADGRWQPVRVIAWCVVHEGAPVIIAIGTPVGPAQPVDTPENDE